jgi:LPXTG-motif cell wall-anchored protein
MKPMKTFSIVMCLFVTCAFLLPTAVADEWNQRTYITFSEPVEVPGTGAQILPAGTYMFKLMDSNSNRHIVQIFSQDGKHVFTTILAIPNYRLNVTDKTVITFWEKPAGQPQAIRAWFYPGEYWGQEFVYPKSAQVSEAVITEPVVPVQEPAPQVAVATPVETPAPAPAEEVAQAMPQSDQAPAQQPEAPALPQTASDLPLIALTGLLSLGAGCGIWLLNRKNAARVN